MTAATREALRRAVDRAVRARIVWDAEARCAGCGVEQIDPWSGVYRYVTGCRTCAHRASKHRQRARREVPQLVLPLSAGRP